MTKDNFHKPLKFQKVCGLVNYNLYESKRSFIENLLNAMKKRGVETHLIDVETINAEIAEKIYLLKPDFTCSFNSFNPDPSGKFLWDYIKIPHISFLVDPVIYSLELTKSPFTTLTTCDLNDYVDLKESENNKAFFFPHAIEEIPNTNQNRIYPVVFLGSCHDFEALKTKWKSEFSVSVQNMLQEAINFVLSSKNLSLSQALLQAWSQHEIDPKEVDFLTLFNYLDLYTRGKDRVELIKSIHSTEVHVFGDLMSDPTYSKGWDYYLKDCKNIVLHKSVSYKKSLEIMQQAKICLNSMPFFKNGSHERILGSLMCGAACLSSFSQYINDEFHQSNFGLEFYQSGFWYEADSKVKKLLENDNLRKEQVSKGKEIILNKHTWDARIDLLNSQIL